MEPQLVTAAGRGQAALLDSQLGFSSLASIPVITKIHTGDKEAAAFLPCTRDVPQPQQRVFGNSLQAAAAIHTSWTLATTWPCCL